mmetsp:Transcript_58003/g.127169  ORF Transcript_58003/g.127169 Transcript_58003/m.127169 type:complete len:109 (-) Transcript_58003:216-542(-)
MGEVAFLQGTVGQALSTSPASSPSAARQSGQTLQPQQLPEDRQHLHQDTLQGSARDEADLRARVAVLQVEREEAWAAAAWQCREATKLRDSLAAAETSLAAAVGGQQA